MASDPIAHVRIESAVAFAHRPVTATNAAIMPRRGAQSLDLYGPGP